MPTLTTPRKGNFELQENRQRLRAAIICASHAEIHTIDGDQRRIRQRHIGCSVEKWEAGESRVYLTGKIMFYSDRAKITEQCGTCSCRASFSFCGLSPHVLAAFEQIVHPYFYPQGTVLFLEGQPPQGVFILCSGRAKLSINASNGKSLMRVTEAGELLGLHAVISGKPYEVSAEMLNDGKVNFVERAAFLKFLREHGEASLRVAELLSWNYYVVCDQIRALALSDSVAEKLAKLLLGWCAREGKETEHGIQLKLSLTHGEIGQMIGASRETVTRVLAEFRSKRVIGLNGSSLYIQNKAALERIVSF